MQVIIGTTHNIEPHHIDDPIFYLYLMVLTFGH
jgi:hypothetical protein